MPSLESAIKWFTDHQGRVTYSMSSRRGPDSYDCSSSVYYALIQGGFLPVGIFIGNTETEFHDLESRGWSQVSNQLPRKRGDIFIWGRKGASSGAFGHTGIFVDGEKIIHCSYGYNGIHVDNHDYLYNLNGKPALTIYRYTGGTPMTSNPVDQVLEPGSYIKLPGTYRVDALQAVSDVWQVKTDALCPVGFTWADNGVPCAPLVEVDANGYATADQVLAVGSKYKIPGKFRVLNVGQSGNRWLCQIEMAGLKLWVDTEPVVEVSATDKGTPTPVEKPAPVVKPAEPVAEPAPVVPPVVEPEAPVVPEEPVSAPVETPDESKTTLLRQLVALVVMLLTKLKSMFK